jgi:hypothetical protein
MTGESLMNNSFDVVGKQFAQSAPSALDSMFKPGIIEILAVIAFFIFLYYVNKGLYKGK